ncbi:MAG: radical SAM protein [Candidatus Shapirobacteria bacterium]
MKVVIGYPPLKSEKGYACLGQNRQFQWVKTPWTAYPVVPAYLATMLKRDGFEVFWLDGIWGEQTYQEWEKEFLALKPDLLFLETKTPVIKKHWQIISKLKIKNEKLKVILFGDHVTALPLESFRNSKVDYVLTGGSYDFLGLNLALHLREGKNLEPGIYYKSSKEKIKNTGSFKLNHNLDSLPFIDRELTKWKLYAYKNSNYLRLPGTYAMFGRDCWWGKCTFCSWTTLYPGKNYRKMSVKRALAEVGYLIENYGIREIMDDSGTFPVGDWLREFCKGMIKKEYSKRARISCNMRFNAGLKEKDYQLMAKAGFRFLLYGLESASQKTLDQIDKNLKVEQIEPALEWAKKAGLNPHLTAMIGYPWESKVEAKKTLDFARSLFRRGLADTLQATIVIPYPGTPLFKEADKKGWLKTKSWERYDMREPILKTKMSDAEIKELVQGLYKSIFTPRWLARKVKEAAVDPEVFQYYLRMAFKFFSKLLDFKKQ